ncbi:hypothetical protein swp_1472 [Shewanella piezotolerans WP3]|uniref:Uncharacterized protein n=1 Tax=Shewanella piezotolerans (strain WP3 / JCM 13877) TaxID=225849 RepID=B8CKT2_SHEPW|nr:hypothetical protein swp_1472 [Shewanella piezotolerans WP3]
MNQQTIEFQLGVEVVITCYADKGKAGAPTEYGH